VSKHQGGFAMPQIGQINTLVIKKGELNGNVQVLVTSQWGANRDPMLLLQCVAGCSQLSGANPRFGY